MIETIVELREEIGVVDKKIQQLEKAVFSKEFMQMSHTQQSLLKIQTQTLKTYHECLISRLFDLAENQSAALR